MTALFRSIYQKEIQVSSINRTNIPTKFKYHYLEHKAEVVFYRKYFMGNNHIRTFAILLISLIKTIKNLICDSVVTFCYTLEQSIHAV